MGAVVFSHASARTFDPEERTFLSLLASQWAQALHRARLYEENERARRNAEALQAEAALLFGVTDAVARAQSLDAIYVVALDAVQATLRVRRASILLFDQDGVMRFKAWRGLSDAYRSAVEGHSPWSGEERDPAPILIEDTELDPSLSKLRPIFQAESIRALAFIPLVHQRLLGKFMVYSHEPRRFAAREMQLAQTIAGQVAQAVTRQRLHDEERRLHREAQEAMRAREELISMASHDLRSPLSAVQLQLHSVLREADKPSDVPLDRAWIRERLGRASANIEKAVQLMDDLLDQARAAAGQLELHLAPVDLLAVVQEYTTRIREQLDRAGCAATIHGSEPVVGRWDRLRIEQAFGNLLSNAMKYGAGKPIEVTVEADEATARIHVRDHGIGIPLDAQARIFEPFRRATSEERTGSFGLGLWIVRQIVTASRGTIAVESAPGAGSVFTVTLPRGR
jgi:signal transduction histidine kinase